MKRVLGYACIGMIGIAGLVTFLPQRGVQPHGAQSKQASVNLESAQSEEPLFMIDNHRESIEGSPGAMAEDTVVSTSLSMPMRDERALGRSGRLLMSLDQLHTNLIETSAFVGLKGQNRQVVAELNLTTRCIAVIMGAEGRISYLTDSARGYSLKARPGYHVFAAGEGKCEFKVGEYPAFDKMKEQLAVFRQQGDSYQPTNDNLPACESLYEHAVSLLLD